MARGAWRFLFCEVACLHRPPLLAKSRVPSGLRVAPAIGRRAPRRATMGFVDLSLRVDPENPHALREHLGAAVALGYSVVATDARVVAGDRNARAALALGLEPLPEAVTRAVASEASSSGTRPRLTRATRVTVTFAEPGELQEVLTKHDDLVRRYDILALEPASERAFLSACNNRRADIIALPLGARLPFRLRPPAVKAAIAHGTCLEIAYNPALMDVAARRQFFANAAAVVRAAGSGAGGPAADVDDDDAAHPNANPNPKSKTSPRGGIVIAGGSRQATELRGPYDVANLATLFGMKDEHARAASSSRCLALLARAERRRKAESEAATASATATAIR